jgi:hypothetical protein
VTAPKAGVFVILGYQFFFKLFYAFFGDCLMATTGRNAAKRKSNLTKLGIFVPIVVAIIGCMAAVAGTEPFASWMVALLPAMATPTPAVASLNSSPLPTGVVTESALYIADAPPSKESQPDYVPGQDWLANCISVKWQAYPPTAVPSDNGCRRQPIWDSISTQNNGLYVFTQPAGLIGTKEYGVFVRLPQNTSVRINVDLDAVTNGQVWFGVFGEPTLTSNGIFIVAPPGDVTKHAFAVKDALTQRVIANSRYYENALGIYSLGFDVSNGVITALAENEALKTISFSSPNRWLFIGYRANLDITNGSADIQAFFSNLIITQ